MENFFLLVESSYTEILGRLENKYVMIARIKIYQLKALKTGWRDTRTRGHLDTTRPG